MTWTLTATGHPSQAAPDDVKSYAAAALGMLDAIGLTDGTISGSTADGTSFSLTAAEARQLAPADDGTPSQPADNAGDDAPSSPDSPPADAGASVVEAPSSPQGVGQEEPAPADAEG